MRATVAEPQGDAREGGAEGSGRQTRDRRNTNRQRGRQWATSVRANTKSNPHQDTASRAGRHAGRVQALTRGDLSGESLGEVSSGRSTREGTGEPEPVRPEKGQRNQQQRSMAHCAIGQNTPRRQQAVVGNHETLREPNPAGRCSRRNREGERNSGVHA
jgi:hypothetical protein